MAESLVSLNENEVTENEVTVRPVAEASSRASSDTASAVEVAQAHSAPCLDCDVNVLINDTLDNVDYEVNSDVIQMLNACTIPIHTAKLGDIQLAEVDRSCFDFDRYLAEAKCNLHYDDLEMSDMQDQKVSINALFDTGTKLSIVREDAILQLMGENLAEIQLQGFDGKLSSGKVVGFYAKLDGANSILIKFVVCKNVTHDCFLSLLDYRRLLNAQQACSAPDKRPTPVQLSVSSTGDAVIIDERGVPEIVTYLIPQLTTDNVDTVPKKDNEDITETDMPVVNDNGSLSLEGQLGPKVSGLVKDQMKDESLAGAFAFAKQRKGTYYTRNGLLYHKATICDRPVERIVVPKGLRQSLLELAHDEVGGHLLSERPRGSVLISCGLR